MEAPLIHCSGWLLKPDYKRKEQIASSYVDGVFVARGISFAWAAPAFKRRFFKLTDHYLLYYRAEDDPTPAGIIALMDVVGIERSMVPDAPRFAVDVRTSEHLYTVAAESESELFAWITAIRTIAPMLQGRGRSRGVDAKRTSRAHCSGWLTKPNYKRKEQLLSNYRDGRWAAAGGPGLGGSALGFPPAYQRRFFELRPQQLVYFRAQDDAMPAGIIELKDVVAIERSVVPDAPPFAIDLRTRERLFTVAAESEAGLAVWVTALRVVAECRTNGAPVPMFEQPADARRITSRATLEMNPVVVIAGTPQPPKRSKSAGSRLGQGYRRR
jgi:hypothetical protein